MKKLLALNLAILPLSLFAFEVNFNKSFSKTVNPDLLTTNFSVTVEKKDEEKINGEIEKFNNYIKKTHLIKIKNSSYSLTPNYTYENNQQNFKGYFGNLSTYVESKNAKDINQFIDELSAIKKEINSDDVKLSISNVSWQISDELRDASYDSLRLDAINWVTTYADNLSNSIKKDCSVKNINISSSENNIFARTMPMMAMASFDSKSAPADVSPVNAEQTININPSFILDCK